MAPKGSSPLACHISQSSINVLASSCFQSSHAIPWAVTKAWRGLTSLNEKCCKACGTRWRKGKERSKGHSALCGELKQRAEAREPFGHCERHKWELQLEEVQSVWINREKHSKSVREWKRKMRHFSLLKLHTRKINWWSSHGVYECYNLGELEYSKEDFATSFVVRLYLLLEIYLLYIQFIIDLSLV